MEGLIYGGKFELSKLVGLALQLEGKLPFLLCFTLYLGAIYKYKPLGKGGGAISQRVFCVTRLGGLYLEGLIHGGAYFQNFTVYLDKYVPYLYQEYSQWLQI